MLKVNNMVQDRGEHILNRAFGRLASARKTHEFPLMAKEVGYVISVSAGVVKVSGLPRVGFEELLKTKSHLF